MIFGRKPSWTSFNWNILPILFGFQTTTLISIGVNIGLQYHNSVVDDFADDIYIIFFIIKLLLNFKQMLNVKIDFNFENKIARR